MREKEAGTRIIYVRHGQTDFPIDRIYCDGEEDPSLNAEGLAQAGQAAEFLAGFQVGKVYASPCARTLETAEIVAGRHGLSINPVESLLERQFGSWDGLYFHEIEKRYPVEYASWKRDQAGFVPEGGESVYDLRDRLQPALKDIVADNHGQLVVVVAHVGPIRVLVAEAMGMGLSSYRQLRIDPASATLIDYGKTQNNLVFLNFHDRHVAVP